MVDLETLETPTISLWRAAMSRADVPEVEAARRSLERKRFVLEVLRGLLEYRRDEEAA